MISVLLLFLLHFSADSFAQQPVCNCAENLRKTIQKTEENYAGFPTKVNPRTNGSYQVLKARLRKQALTSRTAKQCFYVLKRYIRFFYDKHFNLSYYCGDDYDREIIPFIPSDFGHLKKNPVEGIWINADSSVRIGIKRVKDGTYKALKIESTKDSFPAGFVYFTLTPNGKQFIEKSYNRFGTTDAPAKLVGNLLHIWNFETWARWKPAVLEPREIAELASWKNDNSGLMFYMANTETAVLKIPSFQNNDNRIQELVAKADSTIRNTRYLIVDLTGNGGGNSGWIYFLPYFMTNPIKQAPSLVRVTPDNVKLKLPDIEGYVTSPIPAEYKKYFPDSVLHQYKKAFTELPVTRQPFYPVPGVVFPLDSVCRYPEKIALVVDNFCGSSTEYFFNLVKQSGKTISYGIHTVGMMDYEGQSIPTDLPFKDFKLMIPIAQSSWTSTHPIDKTGFRPDVVLKIPQAQWIHDISKDLRTR